MIPSHIVRCASSGTPASLLIAASSALPLLSRCARSPAGKAESRVWKMLLVYVIECTTPRHSLNLCCITVSIYAATVAIKCNSSMVSYAAVKDVGWRFCAPGSTTSPTYPQSNWLNKLVEIKN
mmetsp:Transcript_8637/g.35526  ORF Transcript_8637/g.35526 Transcript_8637/m.35526 type:complete len:123 (-) Transcript_8637:32-400(-)